MTPLLFLFFLRCVFGQVALTLPAISGSSIGNGVGWFPASAVTSVDSNAAYVTLGTGSETSARLLANFNFGSLPLDAIITGISVRILRTFSASGSLIVDTELGLYSIDDTITTRSGTSWSSGSFYNQTFGGPFDTWGITLYRSTVASLQFGFVMKVFCPYGCSSNPQVDYIEMTVYYTNAMNPLTSGGVSTGGATTSRITTSPVTTAVRSTTGRAASVTTAVRSTTGRAASVTTQGSVMTPTTGNLEVTTSIGQTNDSQYQDGNRSILPIGVGVGASGVFLLLGIAIVILVLRKRNKRNNERKPENPEIELKDEKYSPIPEPNNISSSQILSKSQKTKKEENSEPKWKIDYEELVISTPVGQGSFGIVYKAEWRNAQVAVKQLRNVGPKEMEIFISEVNLQSRLRSHPNILQFHGACIDPNNPFCLVTDFMPNGNLRSYLDKNPNIDFNRKQIWIKGIAAGMNHLGKEGIIHRDLAARNILLSADMTAKISDFGMSRFSEGSDSMQTKSDVGPLKWMSPENLMNKEYSTMSDVWSFGVLVFEIVTQQDPYPGLEATQAATQLVAKKISLSLPKGTDIKIQKVFDGCMKWEAKQRLDFDKICKMLAS